MGENPFIVSFEAIIFNVYIIEGKTAFIINYMFLIVINLKMKFKFLKYDCIKIKKVASIAFYYIFFTTINYKHSLSSYLKGNKLIELFNNRK